MCTLDTSHLEMSPLNLFAPGKSLLFKSKKSQLVSVTAAYGRTGRLSQDPIGPCGPKEQSVDSCRHSLMAAWSSALVFGDQPVVCYYIYYVCVFV